jgi:hypothetical protein
VVRIGTWNLDGKWTPQHLTVLETGRCDIWLLTEVPEAMSVDGHVVRSQRMASSPAKSWAAIWSMSPVRAEPSPHPAAACAWAGDLLLCSCVLPWRGARPYWPDEGANIAEITLTALAAMHSALVRGTAGLVWGGDWNLAMSGAETSGTYAGRTAIQQTVKELDLQVPTASLPHARDGRLSIDHLAIPSGWRVDACERLDVDVDGRRLSDHDAYLVDARPG